MNAARSRAMPVGALGALVALAALGCERTPTGRAKLILRLPYPMAPELLQVRPSGLVFEARQQGDELHLDVAVGVGGMRVELPGLCPLPVDLGGLRAGESRTHVLVPLFRLKSAPGQDLAQIGYGEPFTLALERGCAQAARGTVKWEVMAGRLDGTLVISHDGLSVRGRMPSLVNVFGLKADGELSRQLPWGVVPIAPRTQGQVRLRAWFSETSGYARWEEVFTLSAAARSTGLPTLALGQRILLGGMGWRIDLRPQAPRAAQAEGPESSAVIEVRGGVSTLRLDYPGNWRLIDGAGRSLSLSVGRFDDVPLDCGRSGCHPSQTASAQHSPMTESWLRLLTAAPPAPACAVACHTTGEPGLDDGGFAHVLRDHFAAGGSGALSPWEDLPRAGRRLAGVGCLACHGPGAVPPPEARWAILRDDVCANCHDAPPRYAHVVAWRATGMSRADRDAEARTQAACARCHTTWGFLAAQDTARQVAAAQQARSHQAPAHVGAVGLGCAVCHDVHPDDAMDGASARSPRHALVRVRPVPESLGVVPASFAGASSICLECHAPSKADGTLPRASAAALVLGRAGVDPHTGELMVGPAPHALVPGGCIGCHRGVDGDGERARGADHTFTADVTTCRNCHAQPVAASGDDALAERARTLWGRIRTDVIPGERPVHAQPTRFLAAPHKARALGDVESLKRARALWNIGLVLEDRAARVHNPAYAAQLLDSAEAALSSTSAVKARTARR